MRRVIIAVATLGALLLVGFGFALARPLLFPTIEPTLPSYPNAVDRREAATPTTGRPDTRIITFTTSDAPTTVIAYYDASLVPKDWRKNGSLPGFGSYVFEVAECSFWLQVSTSSALPAPTQVELRLSRHGPCL